MYMYIYHRSIALSSTRTYIVVLHFKIIKIKQEFESKRQEAKHPYLLSNDI